MPKDPSAQINIPHPSSRRAILTHLLEMLRSQRLYDASLHVGNSTITPPTQPPSALELQDVQEIAKKFGKQGHESRITFAAEDIFIRSRVEPVQAMLSQWMAGAKAQVNGTDIPFRDIITWCQECHDWEARRILAKETRSLCRFLAPFSHATWQALIAAVTEELGYESYVAYCQERRSTPLEAEAVLCRNILQRNSTGYRAEIQTWLESVEPGRKLSEATRFDAIYLLGMRYMDSMAKGAISSEKTHQFFSYLGLSEKDGLKLHFEGKPGRQSYCVPVMIPGEVHVIMGPVKGWLDWEALFHEMGHAFSFIHTSPSLPVEQREFFTSGAVSETFAFLFQRLCMKEVFIREVVGYDHIKLPRVEEIHRLKFRVLTQRYGAKFLIELQNFKKKRLSQGQEHYASMMEKETGFIYDPETYLFDLMPDFYSLDYLLAFEASRLLIHHLEKNHGERWFLKEEALHELCHWASHGNRYEIHDFLKHAAGIALS